MIAIIYSKCDPLTIEHKELMSYLTLVAVCEISRRICSDKVSNVYLPTYLD